MLKKNIIFILLVTLLAIIVYGFIYKPTIKKAASYNVSKITINNTPVKSPPIIKDSILYLPLRDICETLGYTINTTNNSVIINKDKTTITMYKQRAIIEKEEYKLSLNILYKYPTIIENNSTYVSKQDITDIFELNINKENKTINITNIPSTKTNITFNDGLGNNTIPLEYTDEVFSGSAFKYSPAIAQLGITLSAGAHAMSSLNEAYKLMGYTTLFYNYATVNRTTSAYSIATKELSDKKIYIVAIRGTSGDEWYTNFDIYKDKNTPSTEHYGFSQAEQDVYNTLTEHIAKDNYQGRKIFFITGHSRGGAIANLLGAHLSTDRKYALPEDIYTYTFATPNVSKNADINVKNIYNFCNSNDFITRLPINGKEFNPNEKEWTYNKNGTTINFDYTDIKQINLTTHMEEEFCAITGKTFIAINDDAVSSAISCLKKILPEVDDYYKKQLVIGNFRMSAYEFFTGGLAASQAMGSAAEKGMTLIANGLFNGEMSDIAKFIVFNSTGKTKSNNDGSITEKGRGIKYNHSCEAYYCWIKAYNKAYFSR